MKKIKKTTACAVTGHRKLEEDFDKNILEKTFIKLADGGYDTFLIGMALGFDTICFQLLEKLREKKPIRIIACVPCRCQAEKFCIRDKKEYERMLSAADEIRILSDDYTPYCMMKRNMFMVDNSSLLVAYKRREEGGTAKTVRYAEKCGVKIIEI